MTLQTEDERELRASIFSPRALLFGIGIALIAYLCCRILLPFLPALCWAPALAIIAEPMRACGPHSRLGYNCQKCIRGLLQLAWLGLKGFAAGRLSRLF